jgi:hypothetical protein
MSSSPNSCVSLQMNGTWSRKHSNQELGYLFSGQGQLSPKAWAEKHRSAFEE